MVPGLAKHLWPMPGYVRYPTHFNDLRRQNWNGQRKIVLESALDVYFRKKHLPT
jgi:hypothetical protein